MGMGGGAPGAGPSGGVRPAAGRFRPLSRPASGRRPAHWQLVQPSILARVLGTNDDQITQLATSMGFPPAGDVSPGLARRAYITTFRSFIPMPEGRGFPAEKWGEPVGREAEPIMAEPVGSDLPASHSIILAGRTTLRAVPPRAPESGLSLRFDMKRGASVRPERLGGSNRGYAIREFNVVRRRRAV